MKERIHFMNMLIQKLALLLLMGLFISSTGCNTRSEELGLRELGILQGKKVARGKPGEQSTIPGSDLTFTAADGSTLTGQTVDIDGDGEVDGIDFNGDGIPEFLYLSSSGTKPLIISIDQNGDGVADYYLVDNGAGGVQLTQNSDGSSEVFLVSNGGVVAGVDTTGDLNADDTALGDALSDVTKPLITITPNSGIYGTPKEITLTCIDGVACNAISYTLDNSPPDFAGNGTIIVGKSGTFTLSEINSYTIKAISRDTAGNLSSTATASLEIRAAGSSGVSCSAAAECDSGNCVDGVCCNSPSCSNCDKCNLSGDGSCSTPIHIGSYCGYGHCRGLYQCSGGSIICSTDGRQNCGRCSGSAIYDGGVCSNGYCVNTSIYSSCSVRCCEYPGSFPSCRTSC